MDWLSQIVGGTVLGGAGLVIAAFLLLVAFAVLPAGQRRAVRFPLFLLVLDIGIVALRALVPLEDTLSGTLKVFGAFVVLLCNALLLFTLIVDWLFGHRLKKPLPKIFHDILRVLVYVGVAFVMLPMIGVEPGQLLTTSALLTAVIGLSLQETLGNLFAGLAMQAQRPFQIGDFIRLESSEQITGRVTEINWRATKIMRDDQVELIIPNGMIAKVPIQNFTQPTNLSRRDVVVQGPYEAPPHVVVAALHEAMREATGVLRTPSPDVVLQAYADSGIEYHARYFIDDYARRIPIDSGVRSRIWYTFQRAGITIPFPVRDVRTRDQALSGERLVAESLAEREQVLSGIDFLAGLPEAARAHLARLVRSVQYADGEMIIRQGDAGAELFIVHRGEVAILIGADPMRATEVARLGPGKFVGEMSLMTGEKRTASVRADGPCELYVIGHDELKEILEMDTKVAEHIADVLARRQAQLSERSSGGGDAKAEGAAGQNVLLKRIRSFFSL